MHDPTRIPQLIAALQEAWEGQPDLSFAQLVGVLENRGLRWGTSDTELLEMLGELSSEHPSLIDATAFPADELATVTETGLAESVAEREVGLASVSAPVFESDRRVVAVLSVSGPAERLGPSPAAKWGAALKDATARLSAEL